MEQTWANLQRPERVASRRARAHPGEVRTDQSVMAVAIVSVANRGSESR